jgi:aspartate aminotransferase
MNKLSKMAMSLVGSEIVKLGNEINVRKSKGETIYNYTIGDFDPRYFPIPKKLEELIIAAYKDKRTNYPAGDGLLALREAIGAWFKRKFNIDYGVDEIQISSGGRPIIYTIFKTIVDPSDKVIYTVPSWNNNHYVNMNLGEHCVIEVKPENDFMPTAAEIEPHLSGATLLCLCSPQNPTGTTLKKDELEKICNLVIAENAKRGNDEKKLYVMFDQMYWTLVYGDMVHYNPIALVPEIRPYAIFVDGISKAFAATGVRVGWAMGPKDVIGKIKSFLSHIGAWAPLPEQVATAQFLNMPEVVDKAIEDMKFQLKQRLDYIYNRIVSLREKGYPVDAIAPQAALYLTIKLDFKGYSNKNGVMASQNDVTQFLLSEAQLALVPFNCFGADVENPWYRVSVGTCDINELETVFNNLENAIANLKI